MDWTFPPNGLCQSKRASSRMKPRILVVDDTPLTRETLRQILEADGFEVEAVDDARLALEILQSGPSICSSRINGCRR